MLQRKKTPYEKSGVLTNKIKFPYEKSIRDFLTKFRPYERKNPYDFSHDFTLSLVGAHADIIIINITI